MWAGGKSRLIPKYSDYPGIPLAGYDTYVEPFFGGGAMLLHLAMSTSKIKKFILNDINAEIVGIYRAIQTDASAFMNECDILCDKYLAMNKVDRKIFFYEVRQSYITEYPTWNNIKEAAVLYFLMKTAFNGIFQSTKEAKGRFATPAGLLNHKTEVYDKNNVLAWEELLQKIDIYCGDWKECADNIEGRAFYFMDPPYRDSFAQYNQVFGDDKHLELIEFCKNADNNGHIVFYCNRESDDDFYTKNKGQLAITYYDVIYTLGRKSTNDLGEKESKKAEEILLFSPSLISLA